MSKVKETIRDLVEFSEKQRALQQRKLRAAGKSEKSVWTDAYESIIRNLSSLLDDSKKK